LADSNSDSIIDGHFATNSLENPLWKYACQVYSQPGVEAALLELQDERRADINLILQALWLASEGQEWTRVCIPNDYDKWMVEHVLPLRQMRRNMKVEWVEQRGTGYENFRQQVKKLELKAEQYALAMLFVHNDVKQEKSGLTSIDNLSVLGQTMNILPEHFDTLIQLVQ
jgi:uncharacterized protein (TIGR02444 family)